MKINILKVAEFNSKDILSYNIRNSKGFGINVLNYGGIITDVLVQDKNDKIQNVVMKYKDINTYEENPSYFGACIGRTSGRICNGEVNLNGEILKFNKNYDLHQGHGGNIGFSKRLFNAKVQDNICEAFVEFSYSSKDREEGYPGNLDVTVRYTVTEENEFKITYTGESDKTTLLNLTNHSYFNLAGENDDTVLDNYLYINSDKIAELDSTSVPIGKLLDIKNTPFDFSKFKKIGRDIESNHEQIKIGDGYDHPWILNSGEDVKLSLYNDKSGIAMDIYTNQSSVVLYSLNYPDDSILENGYKANRRAAIAIEPQSLPIGRENCFIEQSILEKGKKYNKETIYKFYIK